MTSRELAAVVLAAGQGKRMGSPKPKVLLEAAGKPLLLHVLAALAPLRPDRTVVVHGHGAAEVARAVASRDVSLVHQPERRGTGDAVRCALPALAGFSGDVLVLYGDTPLLTSRLLEDLVADHRAAGRALTVLSAEVDEPGSLGRVLRGRDGALRGIRETADATPEERAVREVNTGVMVVDAAVLPSALGRLTDDNAQGEYYLTDVPDLLLGDGLAVGAFRTEDAAAASGVNTPEELARADRLLAERTKT